VLTAVGFLILVVGLIWMANTQRELQHQIASLSAASPAAPSVPPPAVTSATPRPSVEPARVAALETRLNSVEQRLDALENRPAPTAGPAGQAVATDNSVPQANLAAEIAALSQRVKDAEQRQATAADKDAVAAQVAALAQRVADAEQRQAALADKDSVAAQVAGLEQRLKDDEQRQVALAAKDALARRLQLASLALDAGEPLGDLPGAPPAISRFAKDRPPTEAALRLTFPAAAAAAEAASRPSADGKSLGERILMHASSLLTIKRGDEVLVGAPATTVLGVAREKLEAGDLAGAIATLDGLDSAAARAIAPWRGEATALLEARAALARMARS
jgi:hypothetical protein